MRASRRNRWTWILLIALAASLGIGSRRYGASLPEFAADYAGDVLWATAAFLGVGLILPGASPWRVAAMASLLSVLVEVSQLSRAAWLESIRRTTLGGLVLGYGFLWSDLACYAVGIGLGILVESAVTLDRTRRERRPPCSHS